MKNKTIYEIVLNDEVIYKINQVFPYIKNPSIIVVWRISNKYFILYKEIYESFIRLSGRDNIYLEEIVNNYECKIKDIYHSTTYFEDINLVIRGYKEASKYYNLNMFKTYGINKNYKIGLARLSDPIDRTLEINLNIIDSL